MNTSTRREITRFLCAAALTGSILTAVGCQDRGIMTDNSRTQGIKLYNDGQYVDAAGSFQNAVRQDPRDYKSFYYLGESLSASKSYQQAIQAFRSSLDSIDITREGRLDQPLRMKVLDGLANAVAKSGTREAEKAAFRTDSVGKESGEDFLLLAKINRYSGDADAALDAYNRASLRDPRSFVIAKEYGLYLEQLGQSQRAEPQLRKAYTMDSTDAQVADALRRLGVVPGPSLLAETKPLITPLRSSGTASAPKD